LANASALSVALSEVNHAEGYIGGMNFGGGCVL
jgi:hypothetical protein